VSLLIIIGDVLSRIIAEPRGTGPFVSILSPISGSVRGSSEPGWRIHLDIDISGTSEDTEVIRSNLNKFIICISGDIGGSGILTKVPNCVPLVPIGESGESASIYDNLLLLKPAVNAPVSSAKAWLQHAAWPLNPTNAIGPSALDMVFVWTCEPKVAIEALSAIVDEPLASSRPTNERASVMKALSVAYQEVAESLRTQAQLVEKQNYFESDLDLFPCEVPPGDGGYAALRLHRTFPYDGAAAYYEYIKTPLAVPPHMVVYSMNSARMVMLDLVEAACMRAAQASKGLTRGGVMATSLPRSESEVDGTLEVDDTLRFASNWSISSCTADVLDQFEERTRLLCNEKANGIDDTALEKSVQELQKYQVPLDYAETPAEDALETYFSGDIKTTEPTLPPNFTLATACLELTTPGIALEYPDDATVHFADLNKGLAPFSQFKRFPRHRYHGAAGYKGPWLENAFITDITARWRQMPKDANHLRALAGPFIPILLPWTDLWDPEVQHRLPPELVPTLRRLLRKNVPYVTLVQHDSGLAFHCSDFLNEEFPNILVLSPGGFGHVPVPLFKQKEELNNLKHVGKRAHTVSYVGNRKNAPMEMRQQMLQIMEDSAAKGNFSAKYIHGEKWRDVMADSRFSLCPRGVGRTSYHLVETLQMGLLPIHIHLKGIDEAWVPYELIWPQVGFSTDLDGLPTLLASLAEMPASEIKAREDVVESYRESHFTFSGALKQIQAFLTATDVIRTRAPGMDASEYASSTESERRKVDRVMGAGSDLVCRRLPTYPTTAEAGMALLNDAYRERFRPGFDPMCIIWKDSHNWEYSRSA